MVSRDNAQWSGLLALQQATHATLHALARQLADLSLTPAELNVLAGLADGRPRTATRLASEVGSRLTTVSSVLDRLEARGHIRRRAHDSDRRAVRIELSRGGRSVASRVRRSFDDLERRAFEDLPRQTVAGFRRALAALIEVTSDA